MRLLSPSSRMWGDFARVDRAMIDNATLMIAVAFSAGALMLTLLISWIHAINERYLLSWACGMAFVVIALAVLGLRGGRYDTLVQVVPFSTLIVGFALIYAGTHQYCKGTTPTRIATLLVVMGLVATNLPIMLGYSGIGATVLNLCCGTLMVLSGNQYWAGRAEAPTPMVAGAVLFYLTGLSFFCCAAMLMIDGTLVLTAPPNNWAEQFNSIMAIVGLTGIGALTLTMNQSRVTRRHRAEALTDSLTGLLNRRALFDRFEREMLPAGTAVLMFDIDHFKQINDRQGHAAGDAVIRNFGTILRHNMRQSDTVARIGGEEFCAVLPPTPLDQAKAIAERIRSDFEGTPTRLLSLSLSATVSIGVATSGGEESFSSVLHRADNALYKAKDTGRNRVTAAPVRLIA